MSKTRHHLFRDRANGDHAPVTYVELFFDLVFVFAITQLSHHLSAHLTLVGALEALLLFLATWWVWIFTSWVTNWLDPERGHVRLMLILLMAGGLALSSALPDAFGGTGLLFAISYVAMQLGRSLYMVWVSRGVSDARKRNFLRISFWFLSAAPFWIAGALLPVEARLGLWSVALCIEYWGPFALFKTPGLGRSTLADWDISGAHMAERCALFIIIALGEAVLVTGATFAGLVHTPVNWFAFLCSFCGSATMWWIYFDVGAKRGSAMISAAENAGRIARNVYTYLHMPIVAGVVVTAVADSLLLAQPQGAESAAFMITICTGPALFLVGNQMFKWISAAQKYPPLSHFLGMLGLLATALGGGYGGWTPLAMALSATASLIFTALWEWFSLHGGWQRWTPWMGRFFNQTGQPN